jgi:integrase
VDAINADLWHRWYVRTAGEVAKRDADPKAGLSAEYARRMFIVSRSFVKWLFERDVISALPKTLASKQYRFDRPDKPILTFANEEIHMLLGNATSQLRLHLLLMLNCGMTQKDISDLRKDQIDLGAGTITRRRSKTAMRKNTPLVCYRLWPCTLEELRKHLSDDPVIALLTRNGNRWVSKEFRADGRYKRADNVAAAWDYRVKKVQLAPGKSLKNFRKTSATRLKSDHRYADLRHHFLGHAAATMADRHYSAESQARLDEAVAWLGQQYGLA